jgi:hypothetical protein
MLALGHSSVGQSVSPAGTGKGYTHTLKYGYHARDSATVKHHTVLMKATTGLPRAPLSRAPVRAVDQNGTCWAAGVGLAQAFELLASCYSTANRRTEDLHIACTTIACTYLCLGAVL